MMFKASIARLLCIIVLEFFVMNCEIGLPKGSNSSFNVLLRSPSVKIPFNKLFSITRATPRPLELTSIRVLDKVVLRSTIGNPFPFAIKSSTFVTNLFPNFPPG